MSSAAERAIGIPASQTVRTREDTAACDEEQRQNDRSCIAQAPNLTRSARGLSLNLEPEAQPAARMSLISGFALIVRAWSSSVTPARPAGLARKKP